MRVGTVSFQEVAVSDAQDLFQIEAVTNTIIILGVVIGQTSDVGDAVAENLPISFNRFTDALTNVTGEVMMDEGDAALTGDFAINVSTELTTGDAIIHADVWNIALPFIWLPPPEMRIRIKVATGVAVRLFAAPADALTMSGTIYLGQDGS